MDTIELSCPGWSSGPVLVATRFGQRWRGLRPAAGGRSLLLRGRSVHGRGMQEPLAVAGLDREGLVVGVETLLPGRVVWMPRAREMLELPAGAAPPPIGARLNRS